MSTHAITEPNSQHTNNGVRDVNGLRTPMALRPSREPWLSTLWNQRFAPLQVGSRYFFSRSVPRMTLIVHPLGMERLFIVNRASKSSKSRLRHFANWLTAA